MYFFLRFCFLSSCSFLFYDEYVLQFFQIVWPCVVLLSSYYSMHLLFVDYGFHSVYCFHSICCFHPLLFPPSVALIMVLIWDLFFLYMLYIQCSVPVVSSAWCPRGVSAWCPSVVSLSMVSLWCLSMVSQCGVPLSVVSPWCLSVVSQCGVPLSMVSPWCLSMVSLWCVVSPWCPQRGVPVVYSLVFNRNTSYLSDCHTANDTTASFWFHGVPVMSLFLKSWCTTSI